MAVRNLWLLGGGLATCLVLCGNGYPQAPIPVPGVPVDIIPPTPASEPVPAPVLPSVRATAEPPVANTVDQLLDQLTKLRQQKAELEKQEEALLKLLRDKLKAQTERLEKLGIVTEAKPDIAPAATSVVPPVPSIDVSKAPR